MTVEELEFLPIEEIIWLPDFLALASYGGANDPVYFDREPYWEITFRAKPKDGDYWFLNRKSPFGTVKIFKSKL